MKFYMASKMHHAERWRKLYSETKHHMVSRWPFLEPFVEPTPENATKFWHTDVVDIMEADCVILYAEGEENLRGALIEAGIAIGLGKPVIVVGDSPEYGTWQHHKLVYRADTIEDALAMLDYRARITSDT